MARVQIEGVGIVEVPDGTNEEVMASARAIRDKYKVDPVDYRAQGLGSLVSSGFQRSLEGLKGTVLDLAPALIGNIIGADDYAKQQLDEYKERMQKAEEANPTAFKSYKQVDSFGNALGYAAETVGEIGPDIAAFVASALTGSFGAGALARRGTAEVVEGLAEKLAAKKGIDLAVAREAVSKQVTGALAEQSAKKLGSRVGLGAASAGINIPDTFQSIYEDTGELRPDLALTVGSLIAALDTYLPAKLLSQLGSTGKAKLAEEMLKKSSVVPTTWKKEFGKALGMTAAGEGITEGTQESLQLFANQLAGSNDPFFSPENIDRIINSAIKGTIGGSVIGAPGAAVQASQVKADRLANIAAQKNQPPPAQINQPPAGEKSAFETQQPDLLGFYKNLEQKPPQAAPKEVDPLAQRTRELFEEFVSKGMPPAQATRQAYEQARAEQQNDTMYSVESGEVADPRIANPRQGVLQFAPPAPKPLPKTQIFDQIQAAKKQYEINLANQQAVQEKQAQVEKIAQRAKAQQQLNLAGLLPEQKTFRPPTANGAPAAQQQPDLFGERGRPSRTEGIRQGQTQSLQEDLTYQQPQISTVLDAETLKNTGLKPQSGYYKQLLGLDMANPDDQIKIGQILTAARQNTSMNQAPIESLRNQAFTGLAQQQSLPLTEAPRGTKSPATVSRPNGKSVPVSNRPAPPAGRPAPAKLAGVGVFENVAAGLGTREEVQPGTLTTTEKNIRRLEIDLDKKAAKGKDVTKERAELEVTKAREAANKKAEEKAEPKAEVKEEPKAEPKAEPKVVKAPETIEGLERQIKNNNDYLEAITDPKQKLAVQRENFKFKQQLTELKDIAGKREFDKIKNETINLAKAGEITDADVGRILEALESGESYEQSVKNATQALDNIRGNKLFQIIKSTPGVNVGRLAKLIGPKLYGNPDYIATVSIKELIQNSFDAIKEGLELGNITNGKISITMNESDRSITILDNGTGMEAAVLGKEFLQIAGTKKGTTRPSGSLGIAKMLFLFANKELKVTTLKNNQVSVLDTTGETLYEALDDSSFAPDINVEKPTAADLKMFPEGHGTHIKITIPKTYINSSTGEETKIDFDGDLYYHKVLMYSPLFDNIEVKFNNKILNIGKNFDINEYTTFANANFNWGTARIYVTKDQQKKYGNNTHILSNGLWQFSTKIKTNPMDYMSDAIGREFYIDVVPKVKAEDPGYPFELSRQSFSKVAQEDFEKIFNYISVLYRQIDFTSDALDFGYVQYLEPSMIGSKIKVTVKEKIEPKGLEKTAASALNIGDDVRVENGQLIVNGRKIPELNTKDLESVFTDTDSLKVDQSTIKNDKVMLHDNLEIPIERTKAEIKADIDKFQQEMDALDKQVDATYEKDDWESKEQEKLRENLRNKKYAIRDKRDKADDELNGFGLTVYSGITDVARYKFGDRFDKFMYEIGDVFKDLRDAVAKHLNYKDLKKEGIGISFDKEYRGVSIHIPFIGLFVNPALPEFSDVTRAAYGTFGTMIHELAHHKVRSHDAAFPAEMQKIILSLKAAKGFDLNALENKLLKSFQDNEDIFVFINKEAKKNDARSIGKQFTDGSQQTATGDVPSDMVKSGNKRERPLAVSRNVKSRAEDVAAKQVFRGIPSKNTEAESTVDPKEKAAIIKDINNLKTQLSVLKGAKLETSTGNTSDKLVEHLQAGNITRALNEIATNKTDFSPLENLIANRLLSNKMFRIPNFELVDSKQIDNAAGLFSPIQDKIFVAKDSMDSHTVLHETVHAFLHSYIVEFEAGAVDSVRLKDLQAIYNHVLKVAPELAAKYGMKNLSEFASEVMSNKKFQGELKQIPYRRENIFTEFARAVMRLFGLADSDIVNTFGSALISIEGLLNTGRNFQETQVTGRRMDIGDINLDSDAFKKWFGTSKVVDKNGKPLVVYHGTDQDISQFKLSKEGVLGKGIYLTPDAEYAGSYSEESAFGDKRRSGGNIMPLYVKIENPLYFEYKYGHSPSKQALEKLGVSASKADDIVEKAFEDKGNLTNEIMSRAKKLGYDGIIYANKNGSIKELVAFESNQIKSIFNKEPTSSPNIAKLIKEENQQATLRNKPNVPGVTGADAQSVFDGFINKIATAPMMNQNRANALHEVLKKGVFGNALTVILSSLPVNVLGMEAERVGLKGATGIGKLIDEQSQYINGQNEKIEPLVRRAEAWIKQATPEMVKLFNSVVYGSTTSKADPTKEKTDYPEATQKDKTWNADYDKVKAEYSRLSGSGKKLYVDMRNAYGATYDEIVRAINERIETFSVDDTIKAKIKADIMAKLVAQGKIEPYFALTRKGNYWLSYNMRDKSGQVETYIEAFEYERARTRAIEELKKEGATGIEQFSKLAEYQYTRAPSGSFVNKVLQVLEGNKPKLPDNATAYQKEKHKLALEKYEENTEEVMRLYISTLPETSFAQSFRKRQNVLGYKEDAVEALRDRLYSTTQQVGRMIYGAKINKLMSDMKTLSKAMTKGADAKDNKLVNEYIKIFEKHIAANSANNNNIITKTANLVNTLTFNYQLGFNVSSAVVQLAQLPMIVTPYLAGDHNWTDTIKAIGAARKAFFASGYAKTAEMIGSKEKITGKAMPSMGNYNFDDAKLSPEIRRLKTLYDLAAGEGQLNRSSFYDVLEVDGRKNILNTVNTASGWAFHHADRMNREISLMAAYNLQLTKLHGKGIKGQAAEDAAARYAVDVAKLTNGNIAAGNAPLISKNALGKVLFMYKGYGVSMYYLLFKITRDALQKQDKEVRRIAMRQIAGIYGTAALFSGLQGIPMFGMAAMVYNLFADDDEDDFETATRKYVGEFAYKGLINEITGLDVAGRIGLSDLIFRTNPTSQSATFQDAFLQTFGGPAYGAGSKIMRGLSKIQEGNIERGIEDILPSFLGNAIKSYRYGTEGATTMRGDPMIEDFSIFSIGAQALGFTPAELSLQQAINAKTKGIEKAILDEKNKLLQRYNISDRVGDVEAREEAKEKLMELNRKHPGLGINSETFERSSRAFLDASKRMVNGVQYSKKLEQEMLDNIAAYN